MSGSQRSILSFFQSNGSSSSSHSSKQPPAIAPRPIAAAPPPPPLPQSFGKFVRPPGANGLPQPPPGMVVRTGGSTQSELALPPVTAVFSQDVLTAAGAVAEDTVAATSEGDHELVFAAPPAAVASGSVRLAVLRAAHIPDLVSVNAILLSARYPDSFYKRIADRTRVSSLFNRALVDVGGVKPKVVGGVICRLEASPFTGGVAGSSSSSSSSSSCSPSPPGLALYVQSLALLSPYRGRGWAAATLDSLVATAAALNATGRLPAPIRALYAHVWTESQEALHWYEARGFVRQGNAPIAGYYFALRPDTAWVVRLDLKPGVLAQAAAAATSASTPAPAAAAAAPPRSTAPPRAAATTAARPPAATPSLSFQNSRPQTEWNDLPADMMSASASVSAAASTTASTAASAASSRNASRLNLTETADASAGDSGADGLSSRPPAGGPPIGGPPTGSSSQASSRSGSVMRKKRDRTYPAAMFGQ